MRADGSGLQGARRILLHGVTGSGRTTLAARDSWTRNSAYGSWVDVVRRHERSR